MLSVGNGLRCVVASGLSQLCSVSRKCGSISLVRNMHTVTFPYFLQGTVDRGFGRGSKELGIPTANFSETDVQGFSTELAAGIYLGWAQVDSGTVNKMVMSVGWNPFYKNEKKAVEVHILHRFDQEFYGSHMRACVLKYLRPEKDFPSLDSLISAINADIQAADRDLDDEQFIKYKEHSFFS